MASQAKTEHKAGEGLGIGPYKVPLSLYRHNRQKLVQEFKQNPAQLSGKAVALLQGGPEPTRYDSDAEPLFRQESNFMYLFGVNEPGMYGTVELDTGFSALYIPRLSEEYAVWLGKILPTSAYKERYGVDAVYYEDEIAAQLKERGVKVLCTFYGKNEDSGRFSVPAKFKGMEVFEDNQSALFARLVECRVVKSAEEIEVMRYAVGLASNAHIEVMKRVKVGMFEYQLESIFKHHCSFHGGSRYDAYTCICGSGDNGSVLHYGHAAAPNDKKINDGDMLLLDMGCEYQGYCSDITCSFPANGKFNDQQCVVYTAVRQAQLAVIGAAKPGVLWSDMHRLAERTILKHLVDAGLVVANGKSLEELHKLHIPALFMPHGLGHFLGMDTHDVGGYPEGVQRIQEPGIRKLRTNRVLKAGMIITVEPGCYFIDFLLDRAKADPALTNYFNWSVVDKYRRFGGVRLEDDVVITETGVENLTTVPRDIEEIERIMAEAAAHCHGKGHDHAHHHHHDHGHKHDHANGDSH